MRCMGKNPKKNSRSSVDRRAVLKNVGRSGVLIGGGTLTALGSNKKREDIVMVRKGDEPYKTKSVPAEWWNHVLLARDLKSEFARKYRGDRNVVLSLGTVDEEIAGRRKTSIVLGLKDGKTVDVPDEIDGVPIRVEEATEPEPDECNCYCANYQNIKGGMVGNGSYGGTGTLGAPGRDKNDNKGVITCAHLFSDYCTTDITDRALQQDGDTIGEVSYYNAEMDWAFADWFDPADESLESKIIDSSLSVIGHVDEDGLQDMASTGRTVHKRGINTCSTTGEVYRTDRQGDSCGDNEYDGWVIVTNSTANGDSGGPYFAEFYNDTYDFWYNSIVGIHHGDAGGNSMGCKAAEINNSDGVTFGL